VFANIRNRLASQNPGSGQLQGVVPFPEQPERAAPLDHQVDPAASIEGLYARHVDAVLRSPAHRGTAPGGVALSPEMFVAVLARRRGR
jgi:hypothetical protein